MGKRSTNLELLRIILTLVFPMYHWALYNGVFFAEESINSIISLILFPSITFPSICAFIALSSYFLIKKKYQWSAKKIYVFLALLITLYIFKTVLINCLFPGYYMNHFVDDFFLKGSWWYIYPYFLLMIVYPLLNKVIYNTKKSILYVITFALVICCVINGFSNNTVFFNDCIMFLSIYFIMGCFERGIKAPELCLKYKKQLLLLLFILCITIATVMGLYFKLGNTGLSYDETCDVIKKIHGRYNIFGLFGGLAIFSFFKEINISYKPFIHRFSKITLFIFLLHETVMSVFWVFQIKSAEFLGYVSVIEFFLWIIFYMFCCIVFATIMYKLYYAFVAPQWDKLITKLNNSTITHKIESLYKKLEEK